MEHMTDELVRQAAEKMEELKRQGGLMRAVKEGSLQREIQQRAYAAELAIQRGERTIVGVNRYQDEEADSIEPPIYQADSGVRDKQVSRLRRVKEQRSDTAVAKALERVRKDCAAKVNIFPAVLEAVNAYATVGEITDAMRAVLGETIQPPIF